MTCIDELSVRVASRRRTIDQQVGEAKALLRRKQELSSEIDSLQSSIDMLDRVTILLNSLGEEKQQQAQATIEALVTQGLHTIFDSSLSFHIVTSSRAKSTGVDFMIRSTLENETVETPVMEARGGGLAATVGFLLRVVLLLLRKDSNKEKLLVLDETFSMVSVDYLSRVSSFLRQIVDKTGIQIIMVTHQEELTYNADSIYRLHTVNGRTKVERVE